MMKKPYSESCDQNRDVILKVIEPLFRHSRAVLEIASGTGQHAVYFARHLPHLQWYTSDRIENHNGIHLWQEEARLPNIKGPYTLDVEQEKWPEVDADTVFSANSAHIMHWSMVEAMVTGVGQLLPEGGIFALYGPFNYGGCFTSESNARFDLWLKGRDSGSGVRDFEAVDELATEAGLSLLEDVAMPANNRTLVWKKGIAAASDRD